MKRLSLIVALFCLAVPGGWGDEPLVPLDWGPLFSSMEDVHGDERLRVLGPLFEKAEAGSGATLLAVRPLYAHVENEEGGWARSDYLWPVGMAKQLDHDYTCRILTAWYYDHDTEVEDSKYRFWILPFWFQGRTEGGETYAALFPLGGTIRDFLRQDEISFALFPLYLHTEVGTVTGNSILWPILARAKGKGGIYRFRIFPLYGQNKHRDQYRKRFILWPIWTWSEYYVPGSEGYGYILFPLFGHIELEDQESWLFLPPFFRFSRGEQLNENYAPWPFFAQSKGVAERFMIWPLYGHKKTHVLERSFYLWPIFRRERIDRGDGERRRFVAAPLLQWETDRRPAGLGEPDEITGRYIMLWPLLSYRREGGASRFRFLELWPLRDRGPVERSYAPFWTLFQRVRVEDRQETELLWGLYRSRRGDEGYRYHALFPVFQRAHDPERDHKAWSLLKGLVGYERKGTQKQFRLLYFLRFGGDPDP